MEIEREEGMGEREVVLQKLPGQALGIQLAEVPSTWKSLPMAVVIKKIAYGSPADRSEELRSVLIPAYSLTTYMFLQLQCW